MRRPRIILSLSAVVAISVYIVAAGWSGELPGEAAITLVVFVIAVWAWIFAPIDDTFIALGAAVTLVIVGIIDSDAFTQTLGDTVVWLLVGAFVLAAAVTACGLSTRLSARVVAGVRTPRQLVHVVTVALVITTFAVPSTSGRAALALPVFAALAAALAHRPRLVLCLALVFPAVILFSAIGSLLGAGAHLITVEIVSTVTGQDIGFLRWLVLGLPLAIVWSHLAAEVALWLTTDRSERAERLQVSRAAFDDAATTGPLTLPQRRVLVILGTVIVLWCSESIHGIEPAIVAVVGALAATAPAVGATTLPAAVKTIPWTLLLFMAATLALGVALTTSGAAQWLADTAFGPIADLGPRAAQGFVIAVVLISVAAHLVMQSRSARSAVLVPIVVVTAPVVGVDPAAAAFLSTAAAGFCITLTSSAKPVAMFAAVDGVPGYRPSDLLRLSAVLAPLSVLLLIAAACVVWPLLGLPLYLP